MGHFRKMNQNGMQGVPGGPQQMGQQVQQQPGQMPGDQQDNNPQIMNFLNEANENNWKEESYRNRVSSVHLMPLPRNSYEPALESLQKKEPK